MKVIGEIKYRRDDSDYIYELFNLPELDEKAVEEAESDISLTFGIINHKSFEPTPNFLLGVYVITEFMSGTERKGFISKKDPVYNGTDAEQGMSKVEDGLRELALEVARKLKIETPELPIIQQYMMPTKYSFNNPSQS